MKLRFPSSPLVRGTIVVMGGCTVGALLFWRGPDWGTVGHAFDRVRWEWVVVAIGLNLISVVLRAYAWRTVIVQAMPPPHPRRSRSACSRTPSCRAGSASSRVLPC